MNENSSGTIPDSIKNKAFAVTLLLLCGYGFFPYGIESDSAIKLIRILILFVFAFYLTRVFSSEGTIPDTADTAADTPEKEEVKESPARKQGEVPVQFSNHSFSELLKLVFLSLQSVLDNVSLYFFVKTGRADDVVLREYSGNHENIKEGVQYSSEEDAIRTVLENKSLVRLDQLSDAQIVLRYVSKDMKGIKSFIGMPVLVENQVIGLLAADSLSEEWFGPNEENLMQIYADLIAGLYRQEQGVSTGKSFEKIIEGLFSFIQTVKSENDQEALTDALLAVSETMISCERLSVSVNIGNNSGKLVRVKGLEDFKPGYVFPLNEGLHGRVIEKEKPYYLPDIDKGEYFIPRYSADEKDSFGIRTFLGVPVKGEGRCFGALCAESTTPNSFTELSQKILFMLSDIVGNKLNITELHAEKDLVGKKDSLTALPNYRLFLDRVEVEIREAKRYDTRFSILIIDVDNFKYIKETFGTEAGDSVLMDTGKLLKDEVRETDFAARYGGIEFSTVLHYTTKNEAHYFAERVRDLINSHVFSFKEHDIKVSVSLGIAEYQDYGDSTAEQLITNAYKALYKAHEQGGNTLVSYSEESDNQ